MSLAGCQRCGPSTYFARKKRPKSARRLRDERLMPLMQGPWKDVDQVERAIFQWVTWYNEERLHSALDYVPPAEYERDWWRQQEASPQSA
ncbi:integrase core domain-containing protein [Streptomyces sp. NPDC014724]|uniref:integrase core domain-containing protein n=1 Tax=unclassified Streptomyces TaxID=2593676 RepID=UPI003701736E